MQTTERNGMIVAATQVATTHELMLMSSSGTLVRTRAAEVSVLGRNTQGVRLIRLDEGERLIGVEAVEPEPEADAEDAEIPEGGADVDPALASGADPGAIPDSGTSTDSST
jgi:DNA gyrase subunit A